VERAGRELRKRLKELAAALKAEPGSIPKRLELAAALREAGRPNDAIDLYRGVAGAYAEDGRLVQAMAVCKGILDIDPGHRDTLEMLATLAQRRKERDRSHPGLGTTQNPGPRLGDEPPEPLQPGGLSDEGERTPAESELRTPVGGDDGERTPPGDRNLTPVPHEEPLNLRSQALNELPDLVAADPEQTKVGSLEAERKRRQSSPALVTAAQPALARAKHDTDPGSKLDFPDETKAKARGHRLLELAPAEEDELLGAAPPATPPVQIDTERMLPLPSLADDDEESASVTEKTRRGAGGRSLESGRLPPIEVELTFGDDDSAVRMLNDVINAPFPRPVLTVEPPPFPLLSDLPRGAFMELLARLTIVRLKAEDVVLREGEAGDACYLIAAGRVRVDKNGVEVAQLGPGSFFGEFAVLSDQRRHASVVAIEPVELLEIRRDLLDELVAAHPGVARTLRTFYRERLLQTLLATAPFFQRLSAEERVTIAERFRPRRFGRGAQIIEEGAPGGGLYLILVGEVEVVRAAKDKVVKLGTLGEGSYFGEMSLLRGGVASATVRATRMTEAVQLPPRDFYEMASQHPVLWEQLRSEAEKRELANHAILAGEARKSENIYLV
jgi:CRP-like cAMP-binding protein